MYLIYWLLDKARLAGYPDLEYLVKDRLLFYSAMYPTARLQQCNDIKNGEKEPQYSMRTFSSVVTSLGPGPA